MRLHLLRHPRPLIQSGLCYGATDVACAASALQEAALRLRDVLPKGLPVICSPLQRCEHLAQVLQRLEPDFAYKTDGRLAEMNFGAWELQAWNAIHSAELAAWTDDFANYRCGASGESAGQFVQRVASCLWEGRIHGQDQVWITHAGVIRALVWLSKQPFALFTALAQGSKQAFEPLYPLRAADWPQCELAFAQVQAWDWPTDWQ